MSWPAPRPRQHMWPRPFPYRDYQTLDGIQCLRLRCGVRQRRRSRGGGRFHAPEVSADGGVTWERCRGYRGGVPMPPCGGDE